LLFHGAINPGLKSEKDSRRFANTLSQLSGSRSGVCKLLHLSDKTVRKGFVAINQVPLPGLNRQCIESDDRKAKWNDPELNQAQIQLIQCNFGINGFSEVR